VTDLLMVLLRSIAAAGAALSLGGVVYVFAVLRPTHGADDRAARRTLALATAGSGIAALAQGSTLALTLGLVTDQQVTAADALRTEWLLAGLARFVALAVTLVLACVVRLPARRSPAWIALGLAALAATASASMTSHAAARVTGREWAVLINAIHQVAVAVWMGGLAHLLLSWPPRIQTLQRFSTVALLAVATLAATGAGLGIVHVGGIGAFGTSYAAMLVTKVLLFAGLVGLAAANRSIVRRLPTDTPPPPMRLRGFVEVEAGVAVTLVFVAASLSSAPPAVDVAERASFGEIVERMAPRWPTLTSPSFAELPHASPPDAPRAPRNDAEFNHNVAGLFVLATGVLAALERTGRAPWARAWPLVFIGLSVFLFLRSDPGHWPFGPVGFWDSVTQSEVVQHWFFDSLPALFGVLEWLQRIGRLPGRPWAYVFPLLSAVGGGLLLAHAHQLTDVKEVFLMEITHLPLGALGIVMGWSRWLELRLPPPDAERAGRVWPPAFALIGLLLVLYRER
jgi:putative copper resistance protein D